MAETTISDLYHRDRHEAGSGEERRAVWRTYARAVIEQMTINGTGQLPWRRAAGDADLPIRFEPFWNRISQNDLEELWRALERARHRARV